MFYTLNESLKWILLWAIPILIGVGFVVERLTRGRSALVQRFAQGVALPFAAVLIVANGHRLLPAPTSFVSIYCEMAWWDLCYWLPAQPMPEPTPQNDDAPPLVLTEPAAPNGRSR